MVTVDRESGKVVQDVKLFDVEKPQFAHKFNSHASPTPGDRTRPHCGHLCSPAQPALDTRTGAKLWERQDFVCNHYRGAGSSLQFCTTVACI